jgi:hypothetical protein
MTHHRHSPAHLRTLLLLCLLGSAAATAAFRTAPEPAPAAPGVYRCGNSYSDAPCPGGRQIDADDGRTEAQKRQAEQAKMQQARLATPLAAERRARERAAGQLPGRLGPTAAEREGSAREARKAGEQKLADKGRKHKKNKPRSDAIARAA